MPGYTLPERLLHRLVLGGRAVGELAFEIDRALARPAPATDGAHVFVAGLARAGTTVLMRRILDSGAFRSLTYADMPFVLAPNLWRRLRGGRAGAATVEERAHGDGLTVTTDSPESLEEVFWRVFDGPAYIGVDALHPHAPDDALIARYRHYVGAILASGGTTRYLSKNNNNILRLPSLARAFPRATILIPFRRPLDHAASLRRQHRRFAALHRQDRFARDYMGWLVHHEFGGDQRPFATHPPVSGGPDTLAYWLGQWVGVHRWLLAQAPDDALFVSHEALCREPGCWRALARRLDIAEHGAGAAPDFAPRPPAETGDAPLPPGLVAEAEALHARLCRRVQGHAAAS